MNFQQRTIGERDFNINTHFEGDKGGSKLQERTFDAKATVFLHQQDKGKDSFDRGSI